MPTTPTYPSIPVPREDLKSLNESVLALKRTVEMLTGQDQKQTYAVHTFVQLETPEAIHVGDFWLHTGESYSLNIWDGTDWLKIGDIVTPAAVNLERAYFARQHFMRRRR